MKCIKSNKEHLWNLCVFPLVFFAAAKCYPTGKSDLDIHPDMRDEKHYPNGTVVGKYTYVDNEGNPIQVKYYADDTSYGVELKSIKVVDVPGEPFPTSIQGTQNIMNSIENIQSKYDFKNIDSEAKSPTNLLSNNAPSTAIKNNKNNDPYDFLNKEVGKTNRYKIEKPNPDYEIYYQNEIKGAKKCGKEKVRVYIDKEKRKIRNAVDNYETDKFCEKF
ncbi:unnamed protein product [Chrysodeixis includens]|uniref:Uncharacterized protein n=1 Tax=Chrysodeixis includens TaxID=689277 RepID=A0A9P0C363_CHRIL|nr:unnamed protein product [Chrysodeixis includens]